MQTLIDRPPPATAALGATRLFVPLAILLALGLELAAAAAGADATWDLRNYHLYNPFALLEKPAGTDIAPAHMQTFLSPTLDLMYYALVRAIPSTPLLNALLAVPQAAAAVMAFALSWRLLRPVVWQEAVALAALSVLAATGTAALPTLATSMSETLPVACVLAAWLTLVRADLSAVPSPRRVLAAGLLVGAACGLKLTLSFAALAMLAATLLLPRGRPADLVLRPFLFGLGLACGTAALTGYWWVHQWGLYGNPVFPLLNQVFRSPQAPLDSFVDRTFLPRSWAEAVAAPWSWALRLSWATGESRLRDPRFAVAVAAAVACLARAAWPGRPRPPWPFLVLPAWFLLAFALWRAEFSIHRYLSVLEFLTGTMVALVAFPLARSIARPGALAAGAVALLAACAVVTVYPRLNRSGSAVPFAVDLGPLPPGATVLLLDNEPMAYLAAFADPAIRFVATNDFFMSLDDANPMQRDVERAIRSAGPLFGLDQPDGEPDRADTTLARYALTRGPCRPVASNVSPHPIRLCQLSGHRQNQ